MSAMQQKAGMRSLRGTATSEAALNAHLPMHLTLTPLIGREGEVAEVCALLKRPTVRLLTLLGTGGVGKTRLGLAVAQAMLDDFADGACFVPLAPVSDPARVLAAISQALGLWETSDFPLEQQVQAVLRDRQLLLVLDNFEHLLESASQIASLLAYCPHLSILVTSRAALHVSGEQQFSVLPLALPDLKLLPEPEALAQLPSVRLFILRAQAVQPAFALTAANAQTVAAICARLDGLPLTIELAAARCKLLPPHTLLQRLSHRLDLLTGGARDLPDRQQTLRNTIQWSYDLLSQEEQRLFRWLAIFVGGCTLQAAEAVCQGSSGQATSVFEGVASLLDKSLLQTEQKSEEPRLVMLEMLREFGMECLQQHGELEAARQAHAHYYLQLSEQAEPHLKGPEQLLWFARLELELDNLWVIFQTAPIGGKEEIELAVRVAGALGYFWAGRGYLREGLGVLEQLLTSTQAIAAPIRLKALKAIGVVLWGQFDTRKLELVTDEALAIAQAQGDQHNIPFVMILHGMVLIDKHDYTAAQACLEEALTRARALGDRFDIVAALANLGRVALYQQAYPQAVAWLEEGLIHSRSSGDKVAMSMVLVVLARAEMSQGNAAHARTLLKESQTIYGALGNTWGVALSLRLLGRLAFQIEEFSEAETFLTDSARLASEVGDRRSLVQSRLLLATLAVLKGDYAMARQRYEDGLSIALDLRHTSLIAAGLKGLGCVAAAQGLHIWAALLWGTAEALHEASSVVIPPDLYDRMVAVVRRQLGEHPFDRAKAQGQTMRPEQVLTSHQALLSQAPAEVPPASHSSPHPPRRSSSPTVELTAREVEVLRLVAQGLTDVQAAEQLVISPRTVNWHLTSIYSKLQVSSRAAATRYAIEQKLI
ncbi:MAG: hypothetical protein PVS3B1_05810 [Ktedonobacteraceae bacterium]